MINRIPPYKVGINDYQMWLPSLVCVRSAHSTVGASSVETAAGLADVLNNFNEPPHDKTNKMIRVCWPYEESLGTLLSTERIAKTLIAERSHFVHFVTRRLVSLMTEGV